MTVADPVGELDARFSEPGAVATPWDVVRDTIAAAELFWITTVRADTRPHVTPLPAVWHDGALHFCTGALEQKGFNLTRNSHNRAYLVRTKRTSCSAYTLLNVSRLPTEVKTALDW